MDRKYRFNLVPTNLLAHFKTNYRNSKADLGKKRSKFLILTHVAFSAPGSSEKFRENVRLSIFLNEHGNTNRMVVWLTV